MIIGKITKVDGTKIIGTFYEKMPPHLFEDGEIIPAPQINSFVKTNVGLDTVICQIVGEHEFDYDRSPDDKISDYTENNNSFMVDLEVRGRIVDDEFLAGLRCLPIVGAKIETLDNPEHKAIFGLKEGISIGTNLFDSSADIYLDPNALIPSHIGIFGNTGSGKSNTLARLIKEYVDLIPSGNNAARVILFDLNNEYGGDAIIGEDRKTIYCPNTGKKTNDSEKIPLNYSTLTEDNWGTLLRATQKTQMPVIRRAHKKWKNKDFDFKSKIIAMIVNKRATAFFTFREYAEKYFTGIDKLSFNSKYNSFYYYDGTSGGTTYCDNAEKCPNITENPDLDDFRKFYILLILEIAKDSESGKNFEFVQPLISRAHYLINDFNKIFKDDDKNNIASQFNKKPITVIQLGFVNSNAREIIPSLISDLVFQDAVESKNDGETKKITSIVIDEAHNLLSYDPDKNDQIHDNTLRVFEKVIKEGRKFGVFLYLSSQRPSDISETITSQIHNYFIHKLVNPRDIERIRKTVSFMGDSSISLLPVLGKGECIISGPSLQMPQYVSIRELENSLKPNSADIIITGDGGLLQKNSFS